MHPICFITKVMSDVEKEFLDVEKRVLALAFACQKLGSFLVPHCFVIITRMSLLPCVLQHVSMPARIANWLVQFDYIKYP